MERSTDSQEIEEQAARWLSQRTSGTWTDVYQHQMEAWLGQRTAHRIAYVRLDAAWNRCARLRALGAGLAPGVIPPRGHWRDSRFLGDRAPQAHPARVRSGSSAVPETLASPVTIRTNPPSARTSGAACARLFVLAATLLAFAVGIYLLNPGLFAGTRYSTRVGAIDIIPLADGSHITLNSDTSVRVILSEHERRIQLEQGEAFFEVAKDKARPFVVYAGDKRVIAVGTKFSVRREQSGIQVVVTEGRVNLAAAEIPSARDNGSLAKQLGAFHISGPSPARPSGAGVSVPASTFLSAGAIAQTSKAEVRVREGAASEAEKLLSWRSGYVVFDNTALADAVAEFNRYNHRKIFIEDPSIAALRIGGNFRADNSDAFLWLLQGGFPIAVEQSDDRVVLKGR